MNLLSRDEIRAMSLNQYFVILHRIFGLRQLSHRMVEAYMIRASAVEGYGGYLHSLLNDI